MKYIDIEEYIAHQKADIQPILYQLRQLISQSAPYIEEKISYEVPFFYYKGGLCYISIQKGTPYIGFVKGYLLSDEGGSLEINGRKQVRSLSFPNIQAWEDKKEILRVFLQEAILINEWKTAQ